MGKGEQVTKIRRVSRVPLHLSTSGLMIFCIVEFKSGFQALALVEETSGIGFLEESMLDDMRNKFSHPPASIK